jgi:3-dehydrotetronate 4-kinase
MLLGCIADDFTGATDLANTLSRQGMRMVQTIGIPSDIPSDTDAIVVALKSRTIPADDAVVQSLEACRWLKAQGARQIFFKYCSTFDSTDKGNIGPVADALLAELGADITIVCPAFPENGRTIYLGHLFVGSVLLSDSSMRHHPLTPMLDSNLVTVMARQSKHAVGCIAYPVVKRGPAAIAEALTTARQNGFHHMVVDALADEDLFALGEACAELKLVTGGSGAALGLPANFVKAGLLEKRNTVSPLPKIGGPAVVLSGSCSAATNAQVAVFKERHKARALDVESLMTNSDDEVTVVTAWAKAQGEKDPVLIYSTNTPEHVAALQARYGRENAGAVIEQAIGTIARRLFEQGVCRFVVAGGETSGAVTSALGVQALTIGPQIAPGVPVTHALGPKQLGLVLKSGNFGGPDFFAQALEVLQ